MPAFKRTEIKDVSFSTDLALNVIDANRNFTELFDITDPKINLSNYCKDFDAKNFKFFLKNLPEKTTKVFF